MREILGLCYIDAARLARLSPHSAVKDYEQSTEYALCSQPGWCAVPLALTLAYAGKGARWLEPDINAGAYAVSLKHGSASDRRAIKAGLALMGHYSGHPRHRVILRHLVERVANCVPGIDRKSAAAALGGRVGLSAALADVCLRELEVAGCYFTPSPSGGWSAVGCDVAGCQW